MTEADFIGAVDHLRERRPDLTRIEAGLLAAPQLGLSPDTRSFARMALGAPISAFTTSGVTGDYREKLRLEGAINYSRQDTTAPYVDYDSVGGELRLIWRFGN